MHDACISPGCGRQGPTGRKGGVSGRAEYLHPVSEVETGVNFRPAGQVPAQVAGSLSRRQPGTGQGRCGDTSIHPEVPPGRGLGIRQSVGWREVCGTAGSGVWVLKGDSRGRMLPGNLDHLSVRWRKWGSYDTAWVTPGHDCLYSYACGHGPAVRPQADNSIWDGVIGLWSRSHPFCLHGVQKGMNQRE